MSLLLQGASRASFADARGLLDTAAAGGPEVADRLADDLFAVAGLLFREPALRRSLTDAGVAADRKVALFAGLVGEQLSEPGRRLTTALVGSRWSAPRDLVDVLDVLAVQAVFVAATARGELDDVEDELFRFGRVLDANPALRAGLTSRGLPAERKLGLVEALLDGKVRPGTRRLVTELVRSPRGRTLDAALEDFANLAAASRQRLLAEVRAAVELTQAQSDRLRETLARMFDRDVELQVAVDPEVIGGLTVRVGDEVIEGSVAAKLDQLRRRLAG